MFSVTMVGVPEAWVRTLSSTMESWYILVSLIWTENGDIYQRYGTPENTER